MNLNIIQTKARSLYETFTGNEPEKTVPTKKKRKKTMNRNQGRPLDIVLKKSVGYHM